MTEELAMFRYLMLGCLFAAIIAIGSTVREPDPALPVVASVRTPAVVGQPPPPPELAQVHGAEPVHAKLAGFDAWLSATYPNADTTFLGTDCATPPCMIGVRFSASRLSALEVRGLLAGVRAEIERRVAIPMTVVHADEDTEGRDHLWMYGLPAELGTAHREALRSSAEQRHRMRMDPLRPPIEPPLPDLGGQGLR